jgi:hypothetical protein
MHEGLRGELEGAVEAVVQAIVQVHHCDLRHRVSEGPGGGHQVPLQRFMLSAGGRARHTLPQLRVFGDEVLLEGALQAAASDCEGDAVLPHRGEDEGVGLEGHVMGISHWAEEVGRAVVQRSQVGGLVHGAGGEVADHPRVSIG